MNNRGTIKNGRASQGRRRSTSSQPSVKKRGASTVSERFAFLIGQGHDLPADFSRNLDHYLYGAPKRS